VVVAAEVVVVGMYPPSSSMIPSSVSTISTYSEKESRGLAASEDGEGVPMLDSALAAVSSFGPPGVKVAAPAFKDFDAMVICPIYYMVRYAAAVVFVWRGSIELIERVAQLSQHCFQGSGQGQRS
jgi:hypothetical protein